MVYTQVTNLHFSDLLIRRWSNKALSVILNSKLHYFLNPQIFFLHIQWELHCYLIINIIVTAYFWKQRQSFLVINHLNFNFLNLFPCGMVMLIFFKRLYWYSSGFMCFYFHSFYWKINKKFYPRFREIFLKRETASKAHRIKS